MDSMSKDMRGHDVSVVSLALSVADRLAADAHTRGVVELAGLMHDVLA